jgi:hypothetical protein
MRDRVDAVLSAEEREAIIAGVQSLRRQMPFLIDLKPDERRALPKMGDGSRAFVNKALDVTTLDPSFLPRAFDLDAVRRDVELFKALEAIEMALAQLHELVDDTLLQVGHEAYTGALEIYGCAKSSKHGPALDALKEDISRRFGSRNRNPAPASESDQAGK